MNSNPNIKPPLPVHIGPYASTLRIHRDERGIAWIDESNTKVIEVVLDHVQGHSPEQIHEEHSHLSLAQIYAAIAYYYDYKQEIDDLMREWQEAYEQGWNSLENQTWRQKMLSRRKERAEKETAEAVLVA